MDKCVDLPFLSSNVAREENSRTQSRLLRMRRVKVVCARQYFGLRRPRRELARSVGESFVGAGRDDVGSANWCRSTTEPVITPSGSCGLSENSCTSLRVCSKDGVIAVVSKVFDIDPARLADHCLRTGTDRRRESADEYRFGGSVGGIIVWREILVVSSGV